MKNIYISVEEYLMGKCKLEDLPNETIANINILIPKINELLERFGRGCNVNSGWRSPADQARINPKAPKSNHLTGGAVDLSDKAGDLNKWLKANPEILEELNLYCEERQGGWQHLQIVAPRSGHRWFNP